LSARLDIEGYCFPTHVKELLESYRMQSSTHFERSSTVGNTLQWKISLKMVFHLLVHCNFSNEEFRRERV
jgi:hypothetical protein